MDVLGAALGLTDEAVEILVSGRDNHARADQYVTHLYSRMREAGFPAGWIDDSHAKITPDLLSRLRRFAAEWPNKAPIRRANFQRITKPFSDRPELLADAIEMQSSAVKNVSDGRLPLDDGRFSHINPRLMSAGFPDGWLEEAEPELTDDMLRALEKLATQHEERHAEEESLYQQPAQAFVGTAPTPAAPNESVQSQATLFDLTQEPSMAAAKGKTAGQPAASRTPTAAPKFKAGSIPTGGAPLAHPTAGKTIPRGAMSAGRPIGGRTLKGSPARAPKAVAAPAPASVARPAPTPAPAAQKSAAAPEKASTKRASSTVTKEQSKIRADNLYRVLEKARRGVKVALWRDWLGSSLAYWGNIHRGASIFRDDLARGAETALGLPQGWLDRVNGRVSNLAEWVTNAEVEIPFPEGTPGYEARKQAAVTSEIVQATGGDERATINVSRPFARQPVPKAGKFTESVVPGSQQPVMPGTQKKRGRPARVPVAGAPEPAPTAVAPAPVAQVPTAQPVQQVIAAPHIGMAGSQEACGPIVEALLSVIRAKALEGKFTEMEALTQLNQLAAR